MPNENDFEMPMHPNDRTDVFKLCLHELGHFLLAQQFGADVQGITIRFTDRENFLGHCAMNIVRPLAHTADIRSYLEDRVCILMAGTLAEQMTFDPITLKIDDVAAWARYACLAYERSDSSRSDRKKGEELLRVLLLMDCPPIGQDAAELNRALTAITASLWERTIGILEERAAKMFVVADLMFDEMKFRGVSVEFPTAKLKQLFEREAENSERPGTI